ncbi:MAG: HAD family hydrolase [Chloroflexota bacterium]
MSIAENAFYLAHRFADIELNSDVIPTLDALGARYRLGVLSSGNSFPDRCGLGGRFQFLVFAQDHRVEKPDPRIFAIALEQTGSTADQILHVGDSLQGDVLGARRAEIASVWLNRGRVPNPSDIQSDVEISSLLELVSWFRRS